MLKVRDPSQVKDRLEFLPYPHIRHNQLSEHICRKLGGVFSEPFSVPQNVLRNLEHYTQGSFRGPVWLDRFITSCL